MSKEKIIISISAIFVGALLAIIALYFYQSTKKIEPSDVKSIIIEDPSPSPTSGLFLTISSPTDEIITDEILLKISGKTIPNAKILVITPTDEQAAVPANDGSFSTDITLGPDTNIIEIIAVSANGEVVKVRRIVSYTTETF
jgi:hypothetical protein